MSTRPSVSSTNSSATGERRLPAATKLGHVLDSSALLALIHRERGWELVAAAIEAGTAVTSAVMVAEVVSRLTDKGLPGADIRTALAKLIVQVEPFTLDDALCAGGLRRLTRVAGLSFGDRACLALAARLGSAAMTADRAWSRCTPGVAVIQIRP